MIASWHLPWRDSPSSPAFRLSRRSRRALFATLALLLLAGAARMGYVLGEQYGIANMRAESNHRLDLFAASAGGIIRQLEPIPATVQLNADVVTLLRHPASILAARSVHTFLHRLNAHIGSVAVYVMDERGSVLASSNADGQGDSAIGADLSFRPYFLDALAGRVGRHFAISIKDNQPGYFVSHPIRDGSRVVGVAAVHISLAPIERTWKLLGVPSMLVDANRVVILSSQPQWHYTALAELPIETRVDLQLTRMYNELPIRRFGLPVDVVRAEEGQVFEGPLPPGAPLSDTTPQAVTLVLSRVLDGMDWRLVTFSDLRDVRRQAVVWGLAFAMAASFCMLLGLYVAQRRRISRQKQASRRLLEKVNVELEHKVVERTRDLTEVNERLRSEMRVREQAEHNLRSAQKELLHGAKMAVLGKLATSITHELMQPLGAIRTLSANAIEFMRRADTETVMDNLMRVSRLADQMGRLIQPLKSFGRKSPPLLAAVDAAHVVSSALFLYEMRARNEQVQVINRCQTGEAIGWCDPSRLEQVLINLVGNAIDSMQGSASRVLTVEARTVAEGPGAAGSRRGGWLRIDVLDTGSGIPDSVRAQLFEPFFTTKSAGNGLGLGLAISRELIREMQGAIEADNRPHGGARFSVFLPAAPDAAAPASTHIDNSVTAA